MRHIVIGNWKMYIEKPEAAKQFVLTLKRRARSLSGVDVVLAPSFPLIPVLEEALGESAVMLGAQTLSAFDEAKHTGDVSATTLRAFGVSHVIVGHSERRAAGESNESVKNQLAQALKNGLTAVLCVGEKERDAQGTHFGFVEAQLASALAAFTKGKLIIAYEPVWAIGKTAAEAMKPAELQEMVIFIRKILVEHMDRSLALKTPILYGGSVEKENAAALVQEGAVSGFLVGRASTDVEQFIEIIHTCRP